MRGIRWSDPRGPVVDELRYHYALVGRSQSNQSESVGRQYKERYQIFVFIALILLIAEIVLSIFVSYKTNVVDKNENKV